jgi:alpha-beta hydrolase superfamily lysophospholipase
VNRREVLISTISGAVAMVVRQGAAAPPQERDRSVTVAGVEIPCRFTIPPGSPRGAILLLPGSLYSNVDGDYQHMNLRPHVYADLARHLSQRGFAVLRMAKVGPGTGSRVVNASAAARHNHFLTRVEVADAALNLLRRTFPVRPLIVAGHSEGAVVASLLAHGRERPHIDGVVSLSGPALPILSILREQVVAMAPPGTNPDMTMFDRVTAAIRAGEPLPEEARTHPQTAMLASMPAQAYAYLRSADEVDPIISLGRVQKPVLILQGGRDDSVPSTHAEMLRRGRACLPTHMVVFPALTHFYKVAPAGLAPVEAMALTTANDPSVAEEIAAWRERLRLPLPQNDACVVPARAAEAP